MSNSTITAMRRDLEAKLAAARSPADRRRVALFIAVLPAFHQAWTDAMDGIVAQEGRAVPELATDLQLAQGDVCMLAANMLFSAASTGFGGTSVNKSVSLGRLLHLVGDQAFGLLRCQQDGNLEGFTFEQRSNGAPVPFDFRDHLKTGDK